MCLKKFINKHYKDYLQARKNEHVIELKDKLLYKITIYSSIALVISQMMLTLKTENTSIPEGKYESVL